MKRWWLLLYHYSYLPIPRRWPDSATELPRALFLLPVYGLLAGLLCWGGARFIWVLGSGPAAALLLGLVILLNGGVWLRDVMLLAQGRRDAAPHIAYRRSERVQEVPRGHRASLIVGAVYLLLQYGCFLALMRISPPPGVFVAAAVFSRWVYLWGAYDFAALAPAFLHQGVSRRAFAGACAFSLLLLTCCAAITPAIWPALLIAALSALLLYHSRRRFFGALDEAVYGAAAAWSEVLLYLSYLIFSVWL